jgi:hypothetical protein
VTTPVGLESRFTLVGNRLRQDPGGADRGPARADFLRQPAEFVMTEGFAQGNSDPALFSADARPTGAPSYAGFEVTWGTWDASSDNAVLTVEGHLLHQDVAFVREIW